MLSYLWILVHDFATQFGSELESLDGDDNEEANEYANSILDPFIKGLLDAILPQVSTVEELEALPDGLLLMSDTGVTVRTPCLPFSLRHGPLTVVWQP